MRLSSAPEKHSSEFFNETGTQSHRHILYFSEVLDQCRVHTVRRQS